MKRNEGQQIRLSGLETKSNLTKATSLFFYLPLILEITENRLVNEFLTNLIKYTKYFIRNLFRYLYYIKSKLIFDQKLLSFNLQKFKMLITFKYQILESKAIIDFKSILPYLQQIKIEGIFIRNIKKYLVGFIK